MWPRVAPLSPASSAPEACAAADGDTAAAAIEALAAAARLADENLARAVRDGAWIPQVCDITTCIM